MTQSNLIRKLEGTEWTDTYPASAGDIKVVDFKTVSSDNMEDYLSVRLHRDEFEDRGMVGLDFLEYISYGRFTPKNHEAELVEETIRCSSKFPMI
jgi:hypothetical protein